MPSENDIMNANGMAEIVTRKLNECAAKAIENDMSFVIFMMTLAAINKNLDDLQKKMEGQNA